MALAAVLVLVAPAFASPALVARHEAPPLPAWSLFCTKSPAQCRVDPNEPEVVAATVDFMDLIEAVNAYVNRTIVPITDLAHRGIIDVWELPSDGEGDCEDFQLLKRRYLADAGVPLRAMPMTVVLDEDGAGHAVLTIRTDRGDLILDNKNSAVKRWNETGYAFVKREAETPTGWGFLEEPPAMMATVTATHD
jgi:predicted transglutaminase-like cysteine proteinase